MAVRNIFVIVIHHVVMSIKKLQVRKNVFGDVMIHFMILNRGGGEARLLLRE